MLASRLILFWTEGRESFVTDFYKQRRTWNLDTEFPVMFHLCRIPAMATWLFMGIWHKTGYKILKPEGSEKKYLRKKVKSVWQYYFNPLIANCQSQQPLIQLLLQGIFHQRIPELRREGKGRWCCKAEHIMHSMWTKTAFEVLPLPQITFTAMNIQ